MTMGVFFPPVVCNSVAVDGRMIRRQWLACDCDYDNAKRLTVTALTGTGVTLVPVTKAKLSLSPMPVTGFLSAGEIKLKQ